MKKEIIKFLGQKVIAFFIMLFFAFLINSFLRVEAVHCKSTSCNHKEQDEACIARCDYSKPENHQEVNGFCDGYYNNDVPPVVKFRCIEVGGGGGGGGGGGRRRRRRRRWRWGGVQTGLNVKCNCNNKIYNACGNYYGLTNIKYRGPCTPTLTGPDTCNAKAINRYYQYQSCAVAPTSTPIPPTATPAPGGGGGSCPWSSPIAVSTLPGSGVPQGQTEVIYPNNTQLLQSFYRGDQGFWRIVPVVSGEPVWANAGAWSAPIAVSTLPGSGSIQTRSDLIIGNGTKLMQAIWRGDQGFWRIVPIVNGGPQWSCADSSSPTATPPLSCLKSQGDANCIGGIDLADFEIWRKEFTGELDTKTADFNDDTKVSLADFEVWRKSYYK